MSNTKTKTGKKQIKQLQNKQNKILTTNLEILKECQKLYNKQKKLPRHPKGITKQHTKKGRNRTQ